MKILQKDKTYIPDVPLNCHSFKNGKKISIKLLAQLSWIKPVIFCIFLPIFPTALAAEKFAPLPKFEPEVLWHAENKSSKALRRRVEFWIKIYRELSLHQIVIHDAKYVDHIYEVITTPKAPEKSGYYTQKAKEKWRRVLLSLHHKQAQLLKSPGRLTPEALTPDKLTKDEKLVWTLFQDIDTKTEPHKFLNAAHRKRLRAQFGQRERFCEGLRDSAPLLPAMEEVFRKQGMPELLTRLPFVESSFNVKARSKVGASGIWQFIKSTAELFIVVNDSVDERNDPILATGAAAQLLRGNFESLVNWPLAVTAYNHGRKGVMRAARKVGSSDLEEIIAEIHQRSFGFASSSFFSELLAAIHVQQNAEKYFGTPGSCNN